MTDVHDVLIEFHTPPCRPFGKHGNLESSWKMKTSQEYKTVELRDARTADSTLVGVRLRKAFPHLHIGLIKYSNHHIIQN